MARKNPPPGHCYWCGAAPGTQHRPGCSETGVHAGPTAPPPAAHPSAAPTTARPVLTDADSLRELAENTSACGDMHMFRADLYCGNCAQSIIRTLTQKNVKDTRDSDDWPQDVSHLDDASDSPSHCGSGEACLNAIELPDGSRIGCWLGNSLTEEGVQYVCDAVHEGGQVAQLWAVWYADALTAAGCDPDEDDGANDDANDYELRRSGRLIIGVRYRNDDRYEGFVIVSPSGTRWHFSYIRPPAAGFGPGIAYDSARAYDKTARAAVDFAINDPLVAQVIASAAGYDGSGNVAIRALRLDAFTAAYLETALWSSSRDGVPYDRDHSITDFAAESLAAAIVVCEGFQLENATDLSQAGTDEQNGHDFWLTRNRHGAGYWSRGYEAGVEKRLTDAAHARGETEIIEKRHDNRLYFA